MSTGFSAPPNPGEKRRPLAAGASFLFLLLVLSLGFMQPPIRVLGFAAVPTDFIYLALVAVWVAALATGQSRLVWHKAYWVLAAYFTALLLSALVSDAPGRSATKLLTQVYLLSLPVLACSLVRSTEDLRSVAKTWLAATALVVLVAAASLAVFFLDPDNRLLTFTRFHFGTLPPGDYPRLRVTFLNANMLCNYLTVSLAILLVARRLAWVSKPAFVLLLAGILVTALTTISPGLGGIGLAICLWLWLSFRDGRKWAARLALAAGLGLAGLFVAAMAVTPILHPTAPFLIELPLLDVTLAPAGRLMIWMDAVKNFAADPLFGRGIGADAVDVRYLDPSGHLQRLTDAHNTFLHIAVQSGLVGLAAMTALLVYAFRQTLPLRFLPGDVNVARLGLGLAFLNGFAYQGLGGAFEDARHLWVLFGLLLASGRIERASP